VHESDSILEETTEEFVAINVGCVHDLLKKFSSRQATGQPFPLEKRNHDPMRETGLDTVRKGSDLDIISILLFGDKNPHVEKYMLEVDKVPDAWEPNTRVSDTRMYVICSVSYSFFIDFGNDQAHLFGTLYRTDDEGIEKMYEDLLLSFERFFEGQRVRIYSNTFPCKSGDYLSPMIHAEHVYREYVKTGKISFHDINVPTFETCKNIVCRLCLGALWEELSRIRPNVFSRATIKSLEDFDEEEDVLVPFNDVFGYYLT